MAHAAIAHAKPGDILVLTSTEPEPYALIGDLMATQAQKQGVAGILVDGAVRDLDEIAAMGLPVWTRCVRAQGATKGAVGELDVPVVVGGSRDPPGRPRRDGLRRRDGPPRPSASTRSCRSRSRASSTRTRCAQRYAAGELSYDIQGLRKLVEG